MTPIHEYVSAHGAIIRPHPATEPAPGGAGLVVVTPSDTWRSLDEHRSDTTVALLAAPDLARGEFMPTVIGTVSVIEPAVPAAGLLDAVAACMEVCDDWRVRAKSVVDDEMLTLDLLGEYRVDAHQLALSSLVHVHTAPDRTVLFQIHATTPADRIDVHESGLRAVEVRSQ